MSELITGKISEVNEGLTKANKPFKKYKIDGEWYTDFSGNTVSVGNGSSVSVRYKFSANGKFRNIVTIGVLPDGTLKEALKLDQEMGSLSEGAVTTIEEGVDSAERKPHPATLGMIFNNAVLVSIAAKNTGNDEIRSHYHRLLSLHKDLVVEE